MYVYIFFFLLFIDLARNKDLYCVWKRIKVEKTVKVVVTSRFKRMSEKKRKECFGLEREENVGMNAMQWNGIWISFPFYCFSTSNLL
jgi:hypothetical protein